MFCPECGTRVNDGSKFCTECGTPLPAPQPAQAPQPQPKPDFSAQTAYRKETFEQGPGQAPNPTQPLPLNEKTPKEKKSGGSRRTGCIVGIIVGIVAILLLGASCTAISQCSSLVSSGSGSHAVSSGNAAASPDNAAVSSKDSWTILFYLCGSNLESEAGLATFNLQELASSTLGDKVTFAIETGGSRSWQNSTVDPHYLTRYTINSDGFYEQQKLPSASMAVTSTFEDFVSWGIKSYPADHYMLVLWDHGGGSVYGVCNDELYPGSSLFQSDTLTLTEISEGLANTGATFDVIGFDTCLMATYETAATLAPYADYLVASEEIEPGSGWDYVTWPQWLGAHTTATGAQLGAEICDTYYSKCKLYNAADMATLSVVDLSKIDALSDSFYGASREIAAATDDRKALRSLHYASLETTCFGGDPAYNMVDLGDLMNKTSDVATEYYDDVIADVENAVVYQVHGRNHSRVSGMSVFYPLDTSYSDEFFDYLDVAANVPYAQFTAVMFGLYNTVNWNSYSTAITPKTAPVTEEGISIDYTERINDDGHLELTVTKGLEDLAEVSVELSLLLPEQRAVVYLGTDYNVKGSFDTGVFTDNFNGQWMAIDDNWVCAMLYEIGDGYNMYYIPVRLNGEDANLIARYDFDTAKYEVVCACASFEGKSKLAAKEMRALEEGDFIEFEFVGYSIDDEETLTFYLGETTWSDKSVMEDIDLGDGGYPFRFALTDVLGEEHMTDLYIQSYQDFKVQAKPLVDYLIEIGFTS